MGGVAAAAAAPAVPLRREASVGSATRAVLHQDAPQCASCHRKIDPIGFGLENFDVVGQWRTEDSYQAKNAEGKPDPAQKKLTWTIDPAGALHGGPAFRDFFELRRIVAGRTDDFARGFAEALVEYALGRPCGFSDEPLVDAVVAAARSDRHGLRTFVHALVASDAFHVK